LHNTNQKLGNEPLGRLLFSQAAPASIGFLVMSIYAIVDTFFVSHFIGKLAIAAVSIVMPIVFLIAAFGMAIGVGGASVISRAIGAGENEKAQKAYGTQISLTLCLLVSFVAFGLLGRRYVLQWFGCNQEIMPFALSYYQIVTPSILFLGWAMMSNNVLRALNKPKVAMMSLIIPAISNIVLDPILIGVFNLGIAGAAWATAFGYLSSGLFTFFYFSFGNPGLKLGSAKLNFDKGIVSEISSIGLITLVRQAAFSILAIFLNNSLKYYGGSTAISVYGIIRSLTLFISFPIIGIMQGFMPIVGFNYGAKKYNRVRQVVRLANRWSIVTSISLYLIVLLFAEYITQFFTDDNFLQGQTPFAMRLVFLAMPIIGIGFNASAYFQSIGKPKQALWLTLYRQGLFMIPLVMILPTFMGIKGIWFSFPIGESLATLVSFFWLKKNLKFLSD
tara:strand:- start:421 stop:1758 length:1338 start_codon:yes stop_codon:yes gene_type:complete